MEDARRKYLHNKIFKAIVPHFVDSKYDHGPFKLIATISGLEIYLWTTLRIWRWSRSLTENGLTQRRFRFFTSPPPPTRGPTSEEAVWLDDADISKYNSLLQRFLNVLEEEEQKRAGGLPMPSMATLMHESMKDGKFWFHELIYSCFESPDSRAWTAIRQLLPSTDELATVPSPEVDLFAWTERWSS